MKITKNSDLTVYAT